MSELDLDAIEEFVASERRAPGVPVVLQLIASARELERHRSMVAFLKHHAEDPFQQATELGWKPDAKGSNDEG